jgi:hypothetical protein
MSNDDFTNADLDGLAPEEDKKPRQSQADKLVELAESVEFFHADVNEPFASVHVGAHVETFSVKSGGFKQWLSRQFYVQQKKGSIGASLAGCDECPSRSSDLRRSTDASKHPSS